MGSSNHQLSNCFPLVMCLHDACSENNSLLSSRVACSKELYSAVLPSCRDFQEHGFILKPLNKFTSKQASDTCGGRRGMWQFGKLLSENQLNLPHSSTLASKDVWRRKPVKAETVSDTLTSKVIITADFYITGNISY